MENKELTHWGIKGMRWGIRRFQNADGSLTKEGKKRYGDDDSKETKDDYEERKQRAVKSGSAKDVLEFKGDLTPQEMQSAISRIRWEQDMQTLSDKEVAAGKARADKVFNAVDKATGYVVTAAKAYNTVANIYNAFSGKDLLPKIETNNTNGNRDKRKSEAKEKKKEAEARKKREEQEAQRETKQKERAEKRAKEEKSDDKVYTGKVTGAGKNKNKAHYKSDSERVVYDAEWTEVTVDDVPSSYTSRGQSFVAGLLEERNK